MKLKICVAVLGSLFASSAFATVLPQCTTNTLAYYVANYTTAATGCQIDDKVFYGFADTLTSGGAASTAGVGITVDPISTVFDPGLNFTLSGFSVGSNSSLDLKVAFDVGVLAGGNLIEDVSLGIGGAQFSGTGLVSIGENDCISGTFSTPLAGTGCSTGGTPPNEISLNVQNPGPPIVFFDTKLTSFTSLVGVFKDVSVTGGSAGSASLSSFTQQFSEVPETSSIVLLGTTLLLTSMVFRRRRVKKS